jgi:hypothetical protein
VNLYIISLIFIIILGAIIFYFSKKKKLLNTFTTQELVIIALFWSLLYISSLPFKFGLSKIPFIHTFFFSVPYSAVLVIGIKLVPKFGTASLLIFGNSLLSQIISRGINPLWWPYALLSGFVLETYFLITKNYLSTMINALGAGTLRGLVVYLYFYFIAGPFIWHKFYAPWYIFIQTLQGVIGSGLGALIGFTLSKSILKGFKQAGI